MIEHCNYASLTTYIFKAEAALEQTMASDHMVSPGMRAARRLRCRTLLLLRKGVDSGTALILRVHFRVLSREITRKWFHTCSALGHQRILGTRPVKWASQSTIRPNVRYWFWFNDLCSLSRLRISPSTARCVRLPACHAICSRPNWRSADPLVISSNRDSTFVNCWIHMWAVP